MGQGRGKMDEFREEPPERPALEPVDVYIGRVAARALDEDLQSPEPEAGPVQVETHPDPPENLESTTDEDKPAFNYGRLIGLLIFVIIVGVKVPPLRAAGIVLGVVVGLYFGVNWLWKGILRQEVRPFSLESGFYWLLLSLGIAFGLFVFGALSDSYPLP